MWLCDEIAKSHGNTVDRVKLASCYASSLDDELSCLFIFTWTCNYLLLELEMTKQMATHCPDLGAL